MPEVLRDRAPAKVNLTLEVLGRRGDGYHELVSVMQTIALADVVEVVLGAEPGIEVTGPWAQGTPTDTSNLAWQAAEALARLVGRRTNELRIRLEKYIPPAGGLGGGASDAAAVLRLLGAAWGAPKEAVCTAAGAVGSDEAFFLVGGTALVEGRGERVKPLPALPLHGVVLLLPSIHIEGKTSRMFAALADGSFDDGRHGFALASRLPCAIRSNELYNRFESVAVSLFPGLDEEWRHAETVTGESFRLAGAGPTLFWLGPGDEATQVAERLCAAGFGGRVIQSVTTGPTWKR